jgi:hypothetical protein
MDGRVRRSWIVFIAPSERHRDGFLATCFSQREEEGYDWETSAWMLTIF